MMYADLAVSKFVSKQMFYLIGSFQERSPHIGNGKWVPPPFRHSRTAESPPLQTAKPKIIPSHLGHRLF